MLTLAYLMVEVWRAIWKPRSQAVVRKSSFRTRTLQQGNENLQQQQQRQQQQQQQKQQSSNTSQQESRLSQTHGLTQSTLQQKQQQQQQQQQEQQQQQQQQQQHQLPLYNVSGTGDNRKVVSTGIPVASRQPIVPSVAKQVQSSSSSNSSSRSSCSQSESTSSNTATSSPQPPKQRLPRLQQQQVHQQQVQPSTSHIPPPPSQVQKSVKTLVLEPSVSGNRMDDTWAANQLDKFHFGFDQADKDKSGSLSFDEVYNVLQQEGFKGSKTEAQFIFGHMDKDESKTVSREEFSSAMKSIPRMSIREFVFRKAFLQMDKDGSGFLTRAEIADATKNEGGIDIGHKVISDLLIYLAEDDENKKVEYDEFLRVLGIETTATVLYKIFKAMDKDGSGFLSKEEMMDAISNDFELKLKASKISELLIALVRDDDGKMSYDEFVTEWLKQRESGKK